MTGRAVANLLVLVLVPLAGQDLPVRLVPHGDSTIDGTRALCSGAPSRGGDSRANDARLSISNMFGVVTEVDVHQFGSGFVDFAAVHTYLHAQLAQRPRTLYRYRPWAEATPLGDSGVVGTIRFATGSEGRFEVTGIHLCIEDASGVYWWIRLAPSDVWPPD
jgi:hypothetical protein